jgi:hypothetical protein
LTSRSDMDKPAALIAALIGVVIILVALPFTIAAFPQTPKAYDVAWGEKAMGSASVIIASDTAHQSATFSPRDFQPASIKVETVPCSDTFNANLQQSPATLHVVLTRAGAGGALKDVTFPCSAAGTTGTFTVKLGDHADIATAQATDPETAKKLVWLDAMSGNVTGASYTVDVTASRPASGIPTLPVTPATPLTASIKFTVYGWDAAVNEHQKEVGK